MNHYPQDIERTVQDSHPALRRDCGAAFSVTDETGAERLVIVQEVERTQRMHLDIEPLLETIREAVTTAHEISVLRHHADPSSEPTEDYERQDLAVCSASFMVGKRAGRCGRAVTSVSFRFRQRRCD